MTGSNRPCCIAIERSPICRQAKLEPAESEVDAAERSWPTGTQPQVLRINLAIQASRLAVVAGEPRRFREPSQARTKALRMREELLDQSRWVEASRLLMLAVDATTMSFEITLLDHTAAMAHDEELRHDGAALAAAFARASQYERALTAANAYEGPDDPDLERIRAVSLYQVGDGEERARARADLERLAERAMDDIGRMAAFHLLIDAGLRDGDWSALAEERLVADGWSADVVALKGYYIERTQGYAAAVTLFEASEQSSHVDEVWLDRAVRNSDPRRVEIARRMLTANVDQMMRLRAAEVLRRAGDVERALSEARRLAFDGDTPPVHREVAFRMAVEILIDQRDAAGAREAHDRWTAFAPSSEAAQQMAPRVGVLARRARE